MCLSSHVLLLPCNTPREITAQRELVLKYPLYQERHLYAIL